VVNRRSSENAASAKHRKSAAQSPGKRGNPKPMPDRVLTQSEKEEAAYYSWLSRGCPLWDDWRDWFKAECELVNDHV
jgi:hypothetical protein